MDKASYRDTRTHLKIPSVPLSKPPRGVSMQNLSQINLVVWSVGGYYRFLLLHIFNYGHFCVFFFRYFNLYIQNLIRLVMDFKILVRNAQELNLHQKRKAIMAISGKLDSLNVPNAAHQAMEKERALKYKGKF